MTSHDSLLQQIRLLAEELPSADLRALAGTLATATPGRWQAIRRQAQSLVANPHYRDLAGGLVDTWHHDAPGLAPAAVALALQSAAYAVGAVQRRQVLELVWTGPPSAQPLRRTDQVLQELIESARTDLLIVAFAVYQVPTISAALRQAANRGVHIALLIESPEASAGKVTYDGLLALGAEVAHRAQVYRWPLDKRPVDAAGKHGSLHAKCAVADDSAVFISSANLTAYALNLNMELGLYIRGGEVPRMVAHHIHQLMEAGVLQPVPPAI